MKNNTVLTIRDNDLCCSCGICKNICPTKAIRYVREKGIYVPEISDDCINCGKCFNICPSVCHKYDANTLTEAITGNAIDSINAWSLNERIRHYSASSGVVTSIVLALLKQGVYDCVFTLDSYDYSEQLKTNRYTIDNYSFTNVDKQKFTKSRYIPVSHENLIEYILNNRNSKVIIIATSCAVRGILNVIEKFRLDRDNYLIIGLFCELTMNYNVYNYFSGDEFTEGNILKELHFKNKDSGGWPGNMKLVFDNDKFKFIDKTHRMKAKDYFQMERCLYCLDKLNICSDISIGDNYTDQNSTPLGSNSIIVRTTRGKRCFDFIKDYIEYDKVEISKIRESQYIDAKYRNYYFSKFKMKQIADKRIMLNSGLSENDDGRYYEAFLDTLKKIELGKLYPVTKKKLMGEISRSGKKYSFIKRLKNYIRRKVICYENKSN